MVQAWEWNGGVRFRLDEPFSLQDTFTCGQAFRFYPVEGGGSVSYTHLDVYKRQDPAQSAQQLSGQGTGNRCLRRDWSCPRGGVELFWNLGSAVCGPGKSASDLHWGIYHPERPSGKTTLGPGRGDQPGGETADYPAGRHGGELASVSYTHLFLLPMNHILVFLQL